MTVAGDRMNFNRAFAVCQYMFAGKAIEAYRFI